MQRTITINKIHIRNFVISIFLGFILLFILEHKNELTFNSYSDNHNKNEGFTWTTKVYLTDNVSNFKYMSYFGNETSISGNGFTVGDLYDEDAPPKSYMFKLYFYTESFRKDIIYGFYISLVIFITLTVFTIFKFSVK